MAVHADIERIFLAPVVVFSIPDSDNELASSIPVGVISRNRDLVVSRLSVASLGVCIGIAGQQSAKVHDIVRKVAQSKGTTGEHAQQLGILQHKTERCGFGTEPAILTMALGSRKQISIFLQASEIFTHVLWRPGVVTSQGGDMVEVRLVGVDGNQGVVRRASSQGTRARVERSLDLRLLWWVKTGVLSPIRGLVGSLEIPCLAVVIGVVTSKEVPRQCLIFG